MLSWITIIIIILLYLITGILTYILSKILENHYGLIIPEFLGSPIAIDLLWPLMAVVALIEGGNFLIICCVRILARSINQITKKDQFKKIIFVSLDIVAVAGYLIMCTMLDSATMKRPLLILWWVITGIIVATSILGCFDDEEEEDTFCIITVVFLWPLALFSLFIGWLGDTTEYLSSKVNKIFGKGR